MIAKHVEKMILTAPDGQLLGVSTDSHDVTVEDTKRPARR